MQLCHLELGWAFLKSCFEAAVSLEVFFWGITEARPFWDSPRVPVKCKVFQFHSEEGVSL